MVPASLRFLVVLSSVVFLGSLAATAAESATPQPLEWNVFLSHWQILGPFPKPDKSSGGTQAKFVDREEELRPGEAVEYEGKKYAWRAWDKRVILFRDALEAQGAAGDNVVAYAWTEFQSPSAQKAVLAVGHDDSVAAWLNGQEVYRNDAALTASFLDQATANVELREGTNTLLLKIGQRSPSWEAAARFRPAGIEQPLISFGCTRQAGAVLSRVPVLQVDLLDGQGGIIQTLRTSGYRNQTPQGLRFVAYAP